jgi:hypothetical protein
MPAVIVAIAARRLSKREQPDMPSRRMRAVATLAAPASPSMSHQDPLWKLRHALAGVAIALLLALLTAALAGRVVGDLFGGGYGMRSGVYAALLLYVVIGAGVLFAKVAQHETRPLSAGRVALWFASLWVWPLLFVGRKKA